MSLKFSMRSTKIQFEMLIIQSNGLNSFLKILKSNCTQFSSHNIAGDVEKRFNDLRQRDLYPSLSMKICITREMDAAVDRQRTCSSCISKIEENRQTYVADTTLLHDAAAPLLLLISLRRISCERRLLEIERSANLNQKRLGSKKKREEDTSDMKKRQETNGWTKNERNVTSKTLECCKIFFSDRSSHRFTFYYREIAIKKEMYLIGSLGCCLLTQICFNFSCDKIKFSEKNITCPLFSIYQVAWIFSWLLLGKTFST